MKGKPVDEKNDDMVVQPGRLVVKKDLGFGQTLKLEGVISPVLSSTKNEVSLDLSEVRHLCSSNLAILASACNTLVRKGKNVKIVAGPSVARVLRLGGIERMATVEEVGHD